MSIIHDARRAWWRKPRAPSAALPFTLVVAAFAAWPASQARAQTAGAGKTTNLESMVDASIKPGDDFFAYANGSWLKATNIPAGRDRWSARDEINDITRRQVAQLLESGSNAPRGSTVRKVADFRAALLNEAAIESKGLTSLKPYLDSIDHVHDKAALTRLLGRGMRADVDPLNWGVFRSSTLLGLSVEQGIHGEKTNVAYLLQGGLGLPDREHYMNTEPRMLAVRTQYRAYMARLLSIAGFDNAKQRAEAVMALETAIAESQTTREQSADEHRADTLWTRESFSQHAPGMDWAAFFAAAGLSKHDTFVPWQPTAIKGAAALVESELVETWKDYLRVRAIDMYADVLPQEIAREAAQMRSAATNTQPQLMARAERANNTTQLAMSDAIGKMYAERYFGAVQKARVETIVANVTADIVRRVETLTWMSPSTKALASQKLKTLYVGVGYPERWSEYADLMVDPADAVGNLRRVADRNYRRAVALLGTPVDMKRWWMPPQTSGAVLTFQLNSYVFAAALLQPPKFDSTVSEAALYGSIGAIIGHDALHFVDVLGAEYEVDGRMRRWWTPDDITRYKVATDPLVKQFAEYRPYPDLAIDGKLTLRENIADLGGLAAAFDAHRRALGSKVADKDYVRRSDREFFIAFAQGWRVKINERGMRTQAATNDHAPEMYAVSTVRNIDAWYDAFDVRAGDRLYLAPSARVRIW